MSKPLSPEQLARTAAGCFDLGLVAMPSELFRNSWQPINTIVEAIAAAVRKGDFAAAHALADTVDYTPAIDAVTVRLAAMAMNSAYVGRMFAWTDNGNMPDDKQMPTPTIGGALNQMVAFLMGDGAAAVRQQLHDVVTLAEGMATAVVKVARLRKSADDALVTALNNAVMFGRNVIDVGAGLTTSRLVSYGSLSELKDRGLTSFTWSAVLDGTTCPACASLHGRKFDLQPALARIEQTFGTTDVDALKELMPFVSDPKQLKGKDLLVPPLHPWCRCVAVPDKSVMALPLPDALKALGLPKPDDPPMPGENEI